MNMRKKQSGFAIVEALIIVVIVAAIGATGWFVYQHNRTQSTGAASNPNPSNNQQTTSPPAPTVTYMNISEWGVKLPLSDQIKDAYYAPNLGSDTGSDGQPNSFLIGVKSLDASGCAATSATAIGIIFRALPTETDSATGKRLTLEYPEGVTIGKYFYAYQQAKNDSCKAPSTTLQSIDSAFTNAQKGTVTATAAN